jgi:Zn-dependent protease
MSIRESFYKEEIRDLAIADIALIIGFSSVMVWSSGFPNGTSAAGTLSTFLYFVPISALVVTLNFILHELMHKFVAMKYGAIAAFKASIQGIILTIASGLMGFLLGITGATMIYTNRFTRKENGIVSIAGPATNIAVFIVFFALLRFGGLAQGSYMETAATTALFVSLMLAFFNMLPIFPLDGSKVLAWNVPLYVVLMAALLLGIVFILGVSLLDLVFVIGFAYVLSFLSRRMF